jgi:uncharacterized membrane protein YtjA (UPF0391 family)
MKMGFTEILTVIFIVLKLVGVTNWNWLLVLLPEIIALVLYVIGLIFMVISFIKAWRD